VKNFEIVQFDPGTHAGCVESLTAMLHEAYAPLAARGMRYLATHQPPAKTLERLSEGDSYLAFFDSEPVATVTLYREKPQSTCEYYRRPGVFSFGQFAVRREFQGRGYGAKLMELVENRARDLGARELALDTSEHATELIATYRRRGYDLVSHTQWDVTNYRSVILSRLLS
jgi:GNAT superfamily N-acetyltransferase